MLSCRTLKRLIKYVSKMRYLLAKVEKIVRLANREIALVSYAFEWKQSVDWVGVACPPSNYNVH